jgi:hypothetical protein
MYIKSKCVNGFYLTVLQRENLVVAHNAWKSKQAALVALAEINGGER